jgi:DNA polymerase elongation subunit (family B)
MKLPLKTVFIDIETSPILAYVWRTGKTQITIDALLPDSMVKIICISYRWSTEKKAQCIYWDENRNDKQLLVDFLKAIEGAECVIGHNEKSFDIKIINARIAYHQLKTQLPIMLIEDTLLLFRKVMNLPSMKLDYLCHYFGIKRKIKTTMDLWIQVCYYNNRKKLLEMGKYCNGDVNILHTLYMKTRPYLTSKMNSAIINENNRICPMCGFTKIQHRGFKYTGLGKYQIFHCVSCGKWGTYGKNLIAGTAAYPR